MNYDKFYRDTCNLHAGSKNIGDAFLSIITKYIFEEPADRYDSLKSSKKTFRDIKCNMEQKKILVSIALALESV